MTRDDEQVPITVTVVEIIDGIEVPIGVPRERTVSRGALELLHGPDWDAEPGPGLPRAVLDRRESAREAYWDRFGGPALSGSNSMTAAALADSIETATRVRVTPEIIEAVRSVTIARGGEQITQIIEVAFRAAGFEVEE